ncbi:PAS domain S-box protein [Flagellimonas iocasae]|uniref:histidine kinase n=1 Tax=Flagellimonas iocasae TaxID=2055905 RepID=A0ABW4Y0G5_9FLAO
MPVNPSILHHAAIPFAVVDQGKTFVDFSKQWLDAFDLGPEIRGRYFYDNMPDLPEKFKVDINHCLGKIEHRSNIQRMVLENGNVVWYDWKISQIKDGDTTTTDVLVILEDVSNKRLEEELLVKSQQVARIGGWVVDLVKNSIYWSAITREIHEVSDDFIPDLASGIFFYKEGHSREVISTLVKRGMESGKKWDTELQIVTAKGNTLWVRAIGEPEMVNGKCVRIIGTFQDIDHRKRAELELLKSQESLKGTLKNSSIGMALVAKDGKFMDVNSSLCHSLGYSKDELLNLTFQDITHPEDLEIDLSFLNELVQGMRETYQIEKRYFDKGGQLVHVILTVTASRNIEGEISHFISQIVDISSRIKTENKLKGLLELTTNQNNSLMNFAHIVSHNLRSHAANLTMISDFLMDDTLGEEIRDESFGMLGRASQSLNETIAHLNEVVQVKLEADRKLKAVNLRDVVEKVLLDTHALIQENVVFTHVDVPVGLQVKGVIAYLESVILNLVTNAIKYRDSGKDVSMVHISAWEKEDTVVLIVEDNGLGIDLDKYGTKLFGMYKTFHGNKDARGIGLFITKNQIEAMGGKISVASKPNTGTTFEVTFLKVP